MEWSPFWTLLKQTVGYARCKRMASTKRLRSENTLEIATRIDNIYDPFATLPHFANVMASSFATHSGVKQTFESAAASPLMTRSGHCGWWPHPCDDRGWEFAIRCVVIGHSDPGEGSRYARGVGRQR